MNESCLQGDESDSMFSPKLFNLLILGLVILAVRMFALWLLSHIINKIKRYEYKDHSQMILPLKFEIAIKNALKGDSGCMKSRLK